MSQLGPSVSSAGRASTLLRRVRAVGPRGVARLAEALSWLVVAKAALAWIPVAKVIAWKQRRLRQERAVDAAALRRVRHAVLAVARYSPVRFVCFPQCLAAAEMLRRRGIASRLHYGVARDGDSLVTHTWLEAGGEIVIGGEVAGKYSRIQSW